MIFVTLGTQDKQFKRLLDAVVKSIKELNIKEKVIFQTGSTNFSLDKEITEQCEIYKYMTPEMFEKYMQESRIIITHAGVGTIIQGLKLHKKMIVAARLKKFGEHVNDHQLQILETFSKSNYILPLYDFDKLNELIKQDFNPVEFKSNNNEFIKKLDNKINELVNKD